MCAHSARPSASAAAIAAEVYVLHQLQAGQAWAELDELEAAEAALSRAAEAAQALAPLCFERRGRGPHHQDAAALCFQIQLDRLGVALRLGQEVRAPHAMHVGRQVCAGGAMTARTAAVSIRHCI